MVLFVLAKLQTFSLFSFLIEINVLSERGSTSTVAEEDRQCRTSAVVAFIDPKKKQNAPTDHLHVVLLAQLGKSESCTGERQAFDLVEFNHNELICIERFHLFSQTEFLRSFGCV